VAAQAVAHKINELEYDMAKSVNKVILVENVGQDS
jgi:hypothetical protein